MTDPPPRLLFASYHCLLDPTSGAAVGVRALLEGLSSLDVPVSAFCGARCDRMGVLVPEWLDEQRIANRRDVIQEDSHIYSIVDCCPGGVPVTIYAPEHEMSDGSRDPTHEEIATFVSRYCRLLDEQEPDVVLTYGGRWVGPSIIDEAKRRGIKVVFWLRNFAYKRPDFFEQVDVSVVPSQFAADHYRDTLGIECVAIPSMIDTSCVICEPSPTERFVTFVNPATAKGAAVFVRIADELSRRRADIPILVVESRSTVDDLNQYGIDLSAVKLYRMPNTNDPRQFYRISKLLLVPSLWRETFGRVAVEAMLNGIPVLASDRGAIPEVIGDAGDLMHVPEKYTEKSRDVPTAEEVSPWVERIIALWDDQQLYDDASRRAREHAKRFEPSAVLREHLEFFRRIAIADR